MKKKSFVSLLVGIILIVCAVFSLLSLLGIIYIHLFSVIWIVVLFVAGFYLIDKYFHGKKHKKKQFEMRNNSGSFFVTITTDTQNIPKVDVRAVDNDDKN